MKSSVTDWPVTKILSGMALNAEESFRQHVPPEAVAYCVKLRADHAFSFRLSRPRRSKWGDYRYRQSGGTVSHSITVNRDLNPYAFLLTYLHEVAHRVAFERHGFRINPHGNAWKQCFAQLLAPVLTEAVFPPDILLALRRYAQNPKASTGADPALTQALQHYDIPGPAGRVHAVPGRDGCRLEVPLSSLAPDTPFLFRQRTYVKKKVRRTRSLCQEISTKKNYLILETTLVERFHYAILTS